MFDAEGGPPDMGHVLMAIDPGPLSGAAFEGRMGDLLAALAAEPGVRLPGSRRLGSRERAAREGVMVPVVLHDEIRLLAGSRG